MSSFVRRVQKKIAKAQGFKRSTMDVKTVNDNGEEITVSVKVIRDSNGDVVGRHWPQVSSPTSAKQLEMNAKKQKERK